MNDGQRPPVDDRETPVGVRPAHYISLNGGDPLVVDGAIIDEASACVSVNGVELTTFMCTPRDLTELALGFLYNEGVINGLDDVRAHHVSKSNSCVDVWLHDTTFVRPRRAIVTAGCGGGLTFDDLSVAHGPLASNAHATPEQLAALMRHLHLGAEHARAHIGPFGPESLHKPQIQRFGDFGRCRRDKRGAVTAETIGQQRELADDQPLPSGSADVEVHAALGIIEHAQAPDLSGQPFCFCDRVGAINAQQYQSAGPNVGHDTSRDFYGGVADALDHGAHQAVGDSRRRRRLGKRFKAAAIS